MSEAGLSPEDQAVLRSGNPTAINARLAGGPAAGAGGPMMLVVDVEGEQVSVRPIGLPQFVQQFSQIMLQPPPQVVLQQNPPLIHQFPPLVLQHAPPIVQQFPPQILLQQPPPQVVLHQTPPLVHP